MSRIADATIPEIEVTTEMIEAGLDVWADWDCRFEGSKEGVLRRIFIEMITTSRNAVRVEGEDDCG